GFAQAPVAVNVVQEKQDYEVALVLVPAPVLEGRVVDDASDAPVKLARIALAPVVPRRLGRPYQAPNPQLAAVTGEDGAFAVSALTPDGYVVKVDAPGYVERTLEFVLPA